MKWKKEASEGGSEGGEVLDRWEEVEGGSEKDDEGE